MAAQTRVAIKSFPPLLTAPEADSRFKFRIGSQAYVRGWDQKEHVLITERLLHLSEHGTEAPHYRAVDSNRQDWILSQLTLSHKPIFTR